MPRAQKSQSPRGKGEDGLYPKAYKGESSTSKGGVLSREKGFLLGGKEPPEEKILHTPPKRVVALLPSP